MYTPVLTVYDVCVANCDTVAFVVLHDAGVRDGHVVEIWIRHLCFEFKLHRCVRRH
jgi:hypothetical protein